MDQAAATGQTTEGVKSARAARVWAGLESTDYGAMRLTSTSGPW
ncbi:hypothetical protein [Streptomyces sp. NPDC056821]